MAQSMFRYGEKALAYAHGFLDSSKKPPFGKRIDGLLNYILDEMHKEEAEAKNKMVIIYQKDSSVLVMKTTLDPLTLPAERSDDRVFIGYIDFCLYGCPILTDKDDRLVNFTTGACLKLKVNVLQERLLVNKILVAGTKLVLSNQLHLKIEDGYRS